MGFLDDAPSGPKTIEAIFQDPRQDRVLRDLDHFFGAHAQPFIRLYEDLRTRPRGSRFWRPSWNWAVLFASYAWFIYRKEWLLAFLAFACEICSYFLPFDWAFDLVSLIFPIIANPLYVRRALSKIAFANAIGLTGERRMTYLARAGGTWPLGGVLAAALAIASLTMMFMTEGMKLLAQFTG